MSDCLDLHLIPKYKHIPPGQLQIAITRLPWFTTERVTLHLSKEDLKLSLLASSAAFPATPLVYRRGCWCMDGGIADFQPVLDADTITVSPFYFRWVEISLMFSVAPL